MTVLGQSAWKWGVTVSPPEWVGEDSNRGIPDSLVQEFGMWGYRGTKLWLHCEVEPLASGDLSAGSMAMQIRVGDQRQHLQIFMPLKDAASHIPAESPLQLPASPWAEHPHAWARGTAAFCQGRHLLGPRLRDQTRGEQSVLGWHGAAPKIEAPHVARHIQAELPSPGRRVGWAPDWLPEDHPPHPSAEVLWALS